MNITVLQILPIRALEHLSLCALWVCPYGGWSAALRGTTVPARVPWRFSPLWGLSFLSSTPGLSQLYGRLRAFAYHRPLSLCSPFRFQTLRSPCSPTRE